MIAKRPYKCVIVDDEVEVANVLRMELIEKFGEDCLDMNLFADGKSAQEFIKNNHVDILLSDIHLNGAFGDQLFAKGDDGVKIIMMFSGDDSFLTVSNCLLDGARYFFSKPFDWDAIMRSFENSIFELDRWNSLFKLKSEHKKAS